MRRLGVFANTFTLVFALLTAVVPPDLACCAGMAEMQEVRMPGLDCADGMDCCKPGNEDPSARRCCSGSESRTNTASRLQALRVLPAEIGGEPAIAVQGGAELALRRLLLWPLPPTEPLFRLHSAFLI